MTDNISTDLERIATINTADSWPTGMRNEGPEEYGISYSDDTSRNAVINQLETLLVEETGPGFYLDVTDDAVEMEYDIIVTVHYHPLAHPLDTTVTAIETVTAYGLDWEPDTIEACYVDDSLVAPGTLDAWFETGDNDYDHVLDRLEADLSDWNSANAATATLEVVSADSDHCHIGLTYTRDFETVLTQEYNLSGSPVWDGAGQTTGHRYYDAEWVVSEIFLDRFSGEATIDNTTYSPDEASDVEAFRRHIATMKREHTYLVPDDVSSDDVTSGLETYDTIQTAHTWTGGNEYPGDTTYAITYDTNALNPDDVKGHISDMLDTIEHHPFTLHDYTDLYAEHDYDLIISATFQLS